MLIIRLVFILNFLLIISSKAQNTLFWMQANAYNPSFAGFERWFDLSHANLIASKNNSTYFSSISNYNQSGRYFSFGLTYQNVLITQSHKEHRMRFDLAKTFRVSRKLNMGYGAGIGYNCWKYNFLLSNIQNPGINRLSSSFGVVLSYNEKQHLSISFNSYYKTKNVQVIENALSVIYDLNFKLSEKAKLQLNFLYNKSENSDELILSPVLHFERFWLNPAFTNYDNYSFSFGMKNNRSSLGLNLSYWNLTNANNTFIGLVYSHRVFRFFESCSVGKPPKFIESNAQPMDDDKEINY